MTTLRCAALTCSAVTLLLVASAAHAADATVDRSSQYQTIEGFGFFGAHNKWWGSELVDEDWTRFVIDDLGITIWRNEYVPPYDPVTGPQDADWDQQRPVAEMFHRIAVERQVPLKTILTVWSPPASMKCQIVDDQILEDTPNPGGTKEGGALCPAQRDAFAEWLVEGLDLYADIGVDVYGLSFQNEPMFDQPFNSCVYTPEQYAETLADIGPTIKASYPNVKLFGAEDMLAFEADDPSLYTGAVLDSPQALEQLGAWAVHGYSDGVTATPTSTVARLWGDFWDAVADTGKPVWMTETSGYVDSWEGDGLPGAMDLAQGIYAALRYGNLSAWVWWQGSRLDEGGPGEQGLMGGTEYQGKRYYVSKNFYRFIRPGARRVSIDSDDEEVLLVAFEHEAMDAFTVVAINISDQTKPLVLSGANLPETFEAYRTSASEDCEDQGSVSADSVELPARSVTTLVNGNVYEDQGPTGGTGGAGGEGPGTGGAPSAGGDGPRGGSDLATGGSQPTTGGRSTGGRPPTTGGRVSNTGGRASTGGLTAGGRAEGPSAGNGPGTAGTEPAPSAGGRTGGAPPASSSGGAAGSSSGTGPAPSSDSSKSDGSCGCVVPGGGSPVGSWLPGFGALALAAAATRRRRRKGQRR